MCAAPSHLNRTSGYGHAVTGLELGALSWLADFIKGVASSVIGDKVKPKGSAETARERAFALYEALASLRDASGRFVSALRWANDPASPIPTDVDAAWGAARTPSPVAALQEALVDVSRMLLRLGRAISEVNPQLEVHVPEVAEDVIDAQESRAMVVSQAEENLAALARGDEAEDLSEVVAAAERAHGEIVDATESVRQFLAGEFSFKESF